MSSVLYLQYTCMERKKYFTSWISFIYLEALHKEGNKMLFTSPKISFHSSHMCTFAYTEPGTTFTTSYLGFSYGQNPRGDFTVLETYIQHYLQLVFFFFLPLPILQELLNGVHCWELIQTLSSLRSSSLFSFFLHWTNGPKWSTEEMKGMEGRGKTQILHWC